MYTCSWIEQKTHTHSKICIFYCRGHRGQVCTPEEAVTVTWFIRDTVNGSLFTVLLSLVLHIRAMCTVASVGHLWWSKHLLIMWKRKKEIIELTLYLLVFGFELHYFVLFQYCFFLPYVPNIHLYFV